MRTVYIPESVRLQSQARAAAFQQALDVLRPQQYEAGQLWSTHSTFNLTPEQNFATDTPRVIVILEASEPVAGEWPSVIAAPISLDVHMASDLDIILTPDRSTLGVSCMAEVWNEVPILEAHLNRFLGNVAPEALNAILNISRARVLGEAPTPELAAWTGPRLFGPTDPRYEFQRAEIMAVAYLAQAATAAIDLPMLSPVPAPAQRQAPAARRRLVFSLQPIRDLLSRYVPGPAVAFAAGEVEDVRTLVHQAGSEAGFTFELWHQRREPYRVSAHVHDVSAEIVNRLCVIEIKTTTKTLHSQPTALQRDIDITIGEQPRFRFEDIEAVTITIE